MDSPLINKRVRVFFSDLTGSQTLKIWKGKLNFVDDNIILLDDKTIIPAGRVVRIELIQNEGHL